MPIIATNQATQIKREAEEDNLERDLSNEYQLFMISD